MQNSKLPTFQVRNVRKFVVHPDFNEKTLENDVALLKVLILNFSLRHKHEHLEIDFLDIGSIHAGT